MSSGFFLSFLSQELFDASCPSSPEDATHAVGTSDVMTFCCRTSEIIRQRVRTPRKSLTESNWTGLLRGGSKVLACYGRNVVV